MHRPRITNKEPREDVFYISIGQMDYTGDVIQVNHVVNYPMASGTNGFRTGARAGLISMGEHEKAHGHTLLH